VLQTDDFDYRGSQGARLTKGNVAILPVKGLARENY